MEQIDIRDKKDDEIELIDFLQIIWRHKRLIIIGTAGILAISVIVSFIIQPTYSAYMIIRPNISEFGDIHREDVLHIDDLKYLKGQILANRYNTAIIEGLNSLGIKKNKEDFIFKAEIPDHSDMLRISVENGNGETAKTILKLLYTCLEKENDDNFKTLIKKFNDKINAERNNFEISLEKERFIGLQLPIIDQEIAAIEKIADELKKTNKALMNEQQYMIDTMGKDVQQTLTAFLYSNAIKENHLRIEDLLKQRTISFEKKYDLSTIHADSVSTRKKTAAKIEQIEFDRDRLKKMELISPPSGDQNSIKPKRTLMISLSGIIGIAVMLFAAFFAEYLQKARQRQYNSYRGVNK